MLERSSTASPSFLLPAQRGEGGEVRSTEPDKGRSGFQNPPHPARFARHPLSASGERERTESPRDHHATASDPKYTSTTRPLPCASFGGPEKITSPWPRTTTPPTTPISSA